MTPAPKFALCLPGGGLTGALYQIGALAALEDGVEGIDGQSFSLYLGVSSGASVGPYDGRSADPFRDDRQRIAPLLEYYPSEFSRFRLQYNYDRAQFSNERANHTVWLGLEFGIGPHAAHAF